jgi:hypothetical protein
LHSGENVVVAPQRVYFVVVSQYYIKYLSDKVYASEAVAAQADACQLEANESEDAWGRDTGATRNSKQIGNQRTSGYFQRGLGG